MSTNDIYDVSAELEKEFGAKGTPQREAAINHAWEGGQRLYFPCGARSYHTDSRNIVQDSSGNGNDS